MSRPPTGATPAPQTSAPVTPVPPKKETKTIPPESLRGFFWHGIVWKNEIGEHAFYDVKIRNGASDYSNTTLMTSDLPPLVVKEDDSIRVLFLLENSYGLQTVRYKVSEASVKGTQITAKLQEMGSVSHKESHEGLLKVVSGDSEWTFLRQGSSWLLYFITIKLSQSAARKYLTLPIDP